MPAINDPRLLYQLHVILETGSLSAAAEVLSVSQPTLSRNMSRLEAYAGRSLMVRGRNGVLLTEAGILIAEQGRRISVDLKQTDDILTALQNNDPPVIRIGMGPLVACAMMNEFVSEQSQSTNNMRFYTEIGSVRQLISNLVHGRLDFAVMTAPQELNVEHLHHIEIAKEYVGLFAGPKSPLASAPERINRKLLHDARWVAIDAGLSSTTSHENMVRRLGASNTQPVIQFDMNIQGLVEMLAHSDALAFLPAKVARVLFRNEGVVEVPLNMQIESRKLALWHAADVELNANLLSVIKKCRAFLDRKLA